MRNYKRKTNRATTSSDIMLRAIRNIKIKGRSIRNVAKDFDIPYRTLSHYCKKIMETDIQNIGSDISINVGYSKCKMVSCFKNIISIDICYSST